MGNSDGNGRKRVFRRHCTVMKIIIAGGRDFKDYNQLCEVCDHILAQFKNVSLVSGTARGADILGERYAKEHGYKVDRFPADWDKHGKRAGYLRNKQMAEHSDGLIAFWDNKSKGTKNMISEANKEALMIVVSYY